ncbi:MAG TPA: MMPL family transporter, partial [Deinococcales bacterium]|nr:MMPL family transporter [Deinococcales bacterium]
MFPRLARLVSTRPWQVLAVWAVVLLLCAPIAQMTPRALTGDTGRVRNSEAWLVQDIIEGEFGQEKTDNTIVVTRSRTQDDDPAFRAAYDAMTDRLEGVEGVYTTSRYHAPSPLRLHGRLEDGYYVTATILTTDLERRDEVLDKVRGVVRSTSIPGTELLVTGASAITKDFVELSEKDTKESELAALPLIALVLVLAFGALVAAGVPLVVGLVSITTSMALLFFLTRFMPVSAFAQSVITMLGLGAGIDYALLMVNRFREELAGGKGAREAAANTTRTAGRAVAFSGLTVGIAMGALLVPQLTFVRSMGVGGVLVILVTVCASVTAVPAILTLLGDRVNSPRAIRLGFRASGRSGFWSKWARRVMARPWPYALAVTALLLFLSWPATRMELGYTGAFGLAPSVESRRGLELIQPLELGGSLDTFEVILDLGPQGRYDAEARSSLRDLDERLNALPEVRLVVSPFLTAREGGDAAGGSLGDLVGLIERSISSDRRYLRVSVIPDRPLKAYEIRGWMDRLRGAAYLDDGNHARSDLAG